MKRPLIPVALGYVAGLLLASYWQLPLPALFGLALVLLLPAVIFSKARRFLLWPLLVLAGWINLTQQTAVLSPQDLRLLAGPDPVVATLRGRLVETPSLRLNQRNGQDLARVLVPVQLTALATNDHWQPATGTVMVTSRGELPDGGCYGGREVEITGVLAPPPGPLAPGLFDYRTFLARQGIHFQLQADSRRDWRLIDANTNTPFADRFREWAQHTLARGLPADDEAVRLLWAMTLGWKTALTGEISDPFMKSGTIVDFCFTTTHI